MMNGPKSDQEIIDRLDETNLTDKEAKHLIKSTEGFTTQYQCEFTDPREEKDGQGR